MAGTMSIDARWRSLDQFCSHTSGRLLSGGSNTWLVVLIYSWLLRHNEGLKDKKADFKSCLFRGLEMYRKKFHKT